MGKFNTGKVICPHCNLPVGKYKIDKHLEACVNLPPYILPLYIIDGMDGKAIAKKYGVSNELARNRVKAEAAHYLFFPWPIIKGLLSNSDFPRSFKGCFTFIPEWATTCYECTIKSPVYYLLWKPKQNALEVKGPPIVNSSPMRGLCGYCYGMVKGN